MRKHAGTGQLQAAASGHPTGHFILHTIHGLLARCRVINVTFGGGGGEDRSTEFILLLEGFPAVFDAWRLTCFLPLILASSPAFITAPPASRMHGELRLRAA